MARWTDNDDEWDGESDLGAVTDEQEESGDDDDDHCIPCPHCNRRIFEESERCPYCEHYLSREDVPPAAKPIWFIVGLFACIYVVYRWIFW
jgi:hypothetical protein